MLEEIIKVSNLFKKFSDFTAVSDLSFSVNKGDVYGFLGQNGAGKSTTIRMLLSLIAPTGGKIEIFGKELQNNRKEILSKIGAVIERPDLYKYLSAYDNINMFAKLSGLRTDKATLMQKLDQVGLAERASSKVNTFSQGMKQRLGIAIAMVHDPELIILDEPTNGLDPQGIADMRQLIINLSKEQGKTVIVSSHLLSEIEIMANRLIIIDKGKTVVQGLAKELLDPAKTIVQVAANNEALARQRIVQSEWASHLQAGTGVLRFEMNKEDIPALTKDLVTLGVEITAVQPRHSLEDYFLQLTSSN